LFERVGGTWREQVNLKPAGVDPGDQFGVSVAFDGRTLAIGAPFEDGSALGTSAVANNSEEDSGGVFVWDVE
jgi:hypothetical protein